MAKPIERKIIAGVLHWKVKCGICKEWVWSQAYNNARWLYECDTCTKPKDIGVGRGDSNAVHGTTRNH